MFERQGNPYDPNNLVKRDFARTLRRAGLPKIRFHDLRHTYAALLIAAGAHPLTGPYRINLTFRHVVL